MFLKGSAPAPDFFGGGFEGWEAPVAGLINFVCLSQTMSDCYSERILPCLCVGKQHSWPVQWPVITVITVTVLHREGSVGFSETSAHNLRANIEKERKMDPEILENQGYSKTRDLLILISTPDATGKKTNITYGNFEVQMINTTWTDCCNFSLVPLLVYMEYVYIDVTESVFYSRHHY